MSGGNHEIHTEQCGKGEDVEFSLFHMILFATQIGVSHKEHDESTDIKHRFHYCHHRSVLIHSSESFGSPSAGNGIDNCENSHKHNRNSCIEHRFATLAV